MKTYIRYTLIIILLYYGVQTVEYDIGCICKFADTDHNINIEVPGMFDYSCHTVKVINLSCTLFG